MEDLKLNIRAIAGMRSQSIADLANDAGINESHLLNVSAGRVKLTLEDAIALSKLTGIPAENIIA